MISEIDNTTIDIISTRLKNIVSPLDIIKWLHNFEKNELEYAIDIACNLSVFTSYEIEEIINTNLSELFPKLKANVRLIINPVGNFGKSGSMVTYFFQKTDFYRKNRNKILMISELSEEILEKDKLYQLILIDDIIGSGNSVKTYYEDRIIKMKERFQEIHFVGIAGMENGVRSIKPFFDTVKIPESNIYKKAFSSEASYFGYRNYSEHREFCYKYGIKLTKPKVRKDGTEKYTNALGYDNSQALVSFSHGSPNNTLPIIWSNYNNWSPLIPRFFRDKISVSKNVRKRISFELSILKEFGSQNLKRELFSYTVKKGNKKFTTAGKIDFSIYGIIKLSRAGYTVNNICQKLGLLSSDYDNIIEEGKKRNLFDEGNSLTLFGLELYKDAKKCIKRNKRNTDYELAEHFKIRNSNYLPKQFNGRS